MKLQLWSASYCVPCKAAKAALAEFTKVHPDFPVEVKDVTDEPDVAAAFGIMSIPVYILLDDSGVVQAMHAGALTVDKLKKFLGLE